MRAGQLLICMEGDKPSRGTIFGSNFLSGYLSDLTQNGTLAQSSELFELVFFYFRYFSFHLYCSKY